MSRTTKPRLTTATPPPGWTLPICSCPALEPWRDDPLMQLARRIQAIPPYLFAEIDRKVAERRAAGIDVISFGVGDPDLPTPGFIVEELAKAARDPSTHRYPSYYGLPAFRQAIADFYRRRF